MKTNEEDKKWGLAFVRKTSLPPYKTWREVPYFTYLIDKGKTTYYIGKREDRPIDMKAIESYPVLPGFTVTWEIKMNETVFLDWMGNYFIGNKDSLELKNRKIIGKDSGNSKPIITNKLLEALKNTKNSQDKIEYEPYYRQTG